MPFLFVTVLVKPVWIDPLYNEFGPMKNTRLERSILDLASRAGIEGSRVFEVNKSVDTKALNAYVTGILGTKRIVLWDTLIAASTRKKSWPSWVMRWGITFLATFCARSCCPRC